MNEIIQVVLLAPAMVFVFAWFFLQMTVRGSHNRYVLRSIIRPTQWLAIAHFSLSLYDYAAEYVSTGEGILWVIIGTYNCSWISVSIWNFYKSDEDDWFSGRGKKIMAGLKRKLRFSIRVPNIAPQGA